MQTPRTYEINYNYVDSSGNEAVTVVRTIEVVDTTVPVITLSGDSEVIYEAGSDYVELGASWTDIVDGAGVALATGTVDVQTPGTYEINYNYVDSSGNEAVTVVRTIEVVDTTAPIIERLGDRNVSIFVWEDFNDPWVEAFDIVDGNLSNHVVREGEIFVDKPDLYELSYHVTDSRGNNAIPLIRYVEVINRAPIGLELSNNLVMENLSAGTLIGEFTAVDLDDIDKEKSYTFELVGDESTIEDRFVLLSDGVLKVGQPLDFEDQAEHVLLVRVTDEFGAIYQKEFTIYVEDTHSPIVDTSGIVELSDGGYQIGGVLLDDGGILETLEFGVLVSDRPILSRQQEGVDDFTLQINEGESGIRSLLWT